MQSVDVSAWRSDQNYWSKGLYFTSIIGLVKCGEASIAGGHLSELHDPLIEHREGQPLSISLHLQTVVNDNCVEVIPLRHVLG